MNRGIAKRVMFERRDDARYFLSRLAQQVRAGRVEVHAYCILQTHYHLLLRSPSGGLSEAMRRVQNAYVRRFNRLRRRDGSLARGRFFSRLVDSDEYIRALVRYIDHNAVRAGIVTKPAEYELGSARYYLTGTRPPWLRTDWLLAQAQSWSDESRNPREAYRRAFELGDEQQAEALVEVVEARMAAMDRDDHAAPLLRAAFGATNAWMQWKARLADGVSLGQPVCGVGTLHRSCTDDAARNGVWMVVDGRRTWRGTELAFIGLARALCGCSDQRLAELQNCSKERVRYLGLVHRRLLKSDEVYAERAMKVGRAAIAAAWSTLEPAECGTPAE
jgi:REP element-mobilizing transposase RayT